VIATTRTVIPPGCTASYPVTVTGVFVSHPGDEGDRLSDPYPRATAYARHALTGT